MDVDVATPTMHILETSRQDSGVWRVTAVLESVRLDPSWDESTIERWLQFPGVTAAEYDVLSYDAGSGIFVLDCAPRQDNVVMRRWLASIQVGTHTQLADPGADCHPNFAGGRRVHLFADDSAVPAVRALLASWPSGVRGMVWLDTPRPSAVADLAVVHDVSVVSFHLEMGFDPLVAAARRVEFDDNTTVWAAGERGRMDSIRSTCLAAGLAPFDTRVFGFWSK